MRNVGLAASIVVIVAFFVFSFAFNQQNLAAGAGLKKFTSEQELRDFIKSNTQFGGYGYGGLGVSEGIAGASAGISAGGMAPATAKADRAEDYSTTNIQVSGVDEADIVKNDGKYVYTLSNGNVVIVDAYPAENARIVSTINLSEKNPINLYVNGDRLVVLTSSSSYYYDGEPIPMGGLEAAVGSGVSSISFNGIVARPTSTKARIIVYDVSDHANPRLVRELEFDGSYADSRMIGNHIYFIVTTPVYSLDAKELPRFSPYQSGFPEVYYFDTPDSSFQFTNMVSLDVRQDDSRVQNKVFLLGYSTSLFVSQDNIYLTYPKRLPVDYVFNRILDEIIMPAMPQKYVSEIELARLSGRPSYEKRQAIQDVVVRWQQEIGLEEIAKLQQRFQEKYNEILKEARAEEDKSVIHKIGVRDGSVNYLTKGEVRGSPLNQFSMDERNGYFRIATTSGRWGDTQENNLYVLDAGMSVMGKLENLAPGERIYSARFVGDRAYLVTFVRIDPLFVIDLRNPYDPKVLGELKIPGVSDYLHPYDDNYLIGVGKSTEEPSGGWARFKGVKISLFDVRDVSNPKELSKLEVGDRGTDSEALRDHHAFLFSKERNLLVLPLSVYTNPDTPVGMPVRGGYWNGAYVFNIDPAKGENALELRGKVTHSQESDAYDYLSTIRRSLYMGDNLYTISTSFLQANSLSDLSRVAEVELPGGYSYPSYEEPL
ncbi:beta-propeller domain-containing protein [Candidatus Micrarchaeota archaeon]|nr:beta-propeller domain-containing protein [Candidatus Micrarchaeota archaeon]